MSVFSDFERSVRAALEKRVDAKVLVDRPLKPSGIWFLMISLDNGFVIEIEWHRHRGFGLAAGWDLDFGSGVDEIFGSADAVLARIQTLVAEPVATSTDALVDIAELRKLCGVFQKDVAAQLGISKSGLAQLEKKSALPSMQVDTLQRIVSVLGGTLVITAQFPEGRNRRLVA